MAGNEIIPYVFYLENYIGKDIYVATENMLAALRPVVGTELTFNNSNKQYKVVRVEPSTNPSNQSNAYYVVDINSKEAPLRLTGMDAEGL